MVKSNNAFLLTRYSDRITDTMVVESIGRLVADVELRWIPVTEPTSTVTIRYVEVPVSTSKVSASLTLLSVIS